MPTKKMNDMVEQLIYDELKECKPTLDEENALNVIANRIKKIIEDYIYDKKLNSVVKEVVFGGSFAKGTWLKNEADIDIFIKFDKKLDLIDFENIGKSIGLESLKEYSPYLRYSDHPYVEARVEKIKINVVPCFDVSFGNWKSAADRSTYHTNYMIKHLNEYKKDQVRLLKKFLRSLGIYGAEISTQGFSGYVSEVLILKFGSFLSAIKFFSNYTLEQNVLHINHLTPNYDPAKKFESFIIILDPIDENRNLGTAISPCSCAILIQGSRKFLESPTNNFFNIHYMHKPLNWPLINLLSPNILVIEFKFTSRPPDVIWGQLKKTMNSLSKFIENSDFKILNNHCYTDEKETAVIVFMMESVTLSAVYKRVGPEIVRNADDVSNFVKSNTSSFARWIDSDTRIKCILFRTFTDVKSLLEVAFREKHHLFSVPRGLKRDFFSTVEISLLNQYKNDINENIKSAIHGLLYTDDRLL